MVFFLYQNSKLPAILGKRILFTKRAQRVTILRPLQAVRNLGLVKGGTVKVRAQGKMVDVKFRISNIKEGYLLSSQRLPIPVFPGTEVELYR